MLAVVAKDVRRELFERVDSDQFRQRASKDRTHCEVRMSVVLPAMMPEQLLVGDAQKRFKKCIAAAAGVKYDFYVKLGKTEAVAAGTMLPVTMKFDDDLKGAEKAAAEGLAGDRVKAALEAAGFGAAHLVAPASVLTAQDYQDRFVASIVEESEARVRVYKAKAGAWFTHNNSRLAKAVSDGLALPLLARAKCDLWLHSDPGRFSYRGLVSSTEV
jgi:hypothetical protein